MTETQCSIAEWQQANFPAATKEGIIRHLSEEFEEFLFAASNPTSIIDAEEEAADILILLYAWSTANNIDLQSAVNEKMRINRSRTWIIQPDGTGRHTKP